MSILDQLSTNKGTVSSALGKTLAQKVLQEGQDEILTECITLSSFESSKAASKHIRSGAAKVVEIVAEKRPELVAPHLESLLPALSVTEPQTRWMIIRVMGFCAHLNQPVAQKAISLAEKYLDKKNEGLCLASSADLFLGDFGALSPQAAEQVFPILEFSMDTAITNEQDWLLEALLKVYPNLDETGQDTARKFAQRWQYSSRKTTQQRARMILNLK
jgi:hypothetical protein